MRGASASGIVVLGAWLASTASADVPTRNGFALAPSSDVYTAGAAPPPGD